MSEEESQLETEDNEQDNYCFEMEIDGGRGLQAVMSFLGSITLLTTIIVTIIYFIKLKWLGGFTTLFLGIVLALIIFSVSKILQLITINIIKMNSIEEQLNELAENGIVELVIDPNIKMPNKETRRKKWDIWRNEKY